MPSIRSWAMRKRFRYIISCALVAILLFGRNGSPLAHPGPYIGARFWPRPCAFDVSSMVRLRSSLWATPATVSAVSFPKRSPTSLLTTAALGGLKSAPASRLRGAHPHLLHSFVAHYVMHTFTPIEVSLNTFAALYALFKNPLNTALLVTWYPLKT